MCLFFLRCWSLYVSAADILCSYFMLKFKVPIHSVVFDAETQVSSSLMHMPVNSSELLFWSSVEFLTTYFRLGRLDISLQCVCVNTYTCVCICTNFFYIFSSFKKNLCSKAYPYTTCIEEYQAFCLIRIFKI